MFKIKICGVRFKSDVEAVAAAGADAIGLNFFPKSIRYVDPESALCKDLSGHASDLRLKRIGVFVNESDATIRRIAESVGLDAIQLHGDETVPFVEKLDVHDLPIIRAIKVSTAATDALKAISDAALPWIELGCHLLFDADAGAAHGGSGKTIDWQAMRMWANRHSNVQWTLAGGLTPENVSEAIRVSGATSVDTASGVESPKGTKSVTGISEFAQNCLKSFASSGV